MGQIMTSQVSRNDCNKFWVKSIKSENYMEKHKITVWPQKLVAPVPDKV